MEDSPDPDASRRPARAASTAWQTSLDLATVGVELAGIVGGMTALGYLLDYWLNATPLFILIGACVGIFGGLYRTIRRVSAPKARR